LIDLRTPNEYIQGSIPHFKNIPLDELRDRLSEIDFTKPIYIICQSGLRSYLACRILSQRGYDCYNIIGGYNFLNIQHMNKKLFGGNYRNHLK
jgi:rhodanese-related sulfurtransferase